MEAERVKTKKVSAADRIPEKTGRKKWSVLFLESLLKEAKEREAESEKARPAVDGESWILSLIHILVYSRRTSGRFITEDCHMIEQLKTSLATEKMEEFLAQMRQLGFQNDEILSLMNPVSYTHLDVYKRQDMHRWQKASPPPAPPDTPPLRSRTVPATSHAPPAADA